VEREAREVAADYAETAFLMGSSGGPEGDNFGVFGTRNHEAAYLAGMLAGTMSETQCLRLGRWLPDPRGEPADQRVPHGRDRR
jgi:basic membrane lipoprotein Med (substrate-binding protein (PBP1-ABC) superfamily)